MVKAIWRGVVLAASDDTVVVEGNHYFPRGALDIQYFRASHEHTVCVWKGTASYFDIVVGAETNPMAAWSYIDPSPAAEQIRGRVAFWRGVRVED